MQSNIFHTVKTYIPEILSLLIMAAGLILSATGLNTIWIYLIAILPVCGIMLKGTFKAWSKGDIFNEFTLMILACTGAFIIGEYPEAVAILIFYSFGEKLEELASDKARERIRSIINILPRKVRIVADDGTETMKEPESVKIGEIIEVRPGERLGLDGQLAEVYHAKFNLSAITGESMPVTVTEEDTVPSGAIAEGSAVRIRVTHSYNDSAMGRIMDLIEKASEEKSRPESMLRKITRWYTPAVIIAALALFVTPWAVCTLKGTFFDWYQWLERSLILLVCSCPCALIVSIPLSYFAAVGTASKYGVLFKGSTYIDMLRKCDSLMLDKTGTITTGHFEVIRGIPAVNHTKEEVLGLAAMTDASSNHPLAQAICELPTPRIPGLILNEVNEIDHGVKATSNMGTILVGSRALLNAEGIDTSALPNVDDTEVCVSLGNEFIGTIILADTLKPGIARTIFNLRKLGIKSIGILSGDNERAVANVARQAGVDFHTSQMRPADKQTMVLKRIRSGRPTIFVGDGINDAPSLAAATIGIAIGTGGSDLAMESADAVIMGKDLSRLADTLRLSRRLHNVVIENVSFAIGVKLAVMILGAFGLASLWAAVFADTGIMLLTVLWTMFSLRPKASS